MPSSRIFYLSRYVLLAYNSPMHETGAKDGRVASVRWLSYI